MGERMSRQERVSMKGGGGGCRVRVLKFWMCESKDVQMKPLLRLLMDTKGLSTVGFCLQILFTF